MLTVYTKNEWAKTRERIRFYSNACGDLFDSANEKDLEVHELPASLRDVFENYYTEGAGAYCYLVMMDDVPGLMFTCEYHEYTPEGAFGDKNNYARALKVAAALSERTDCPVILAKEVGFPGMTSEGEGDYATELSVFISQEKLHAGADSIVDLFAGIAYVYDGKPDALDYMYELKDGVKPSDLKEYTVSVKVDGRVDIRVVATSFEEAFKKADYDFPMADLSEMEIVDTCLVKAEREDGKFEDYNG